MITGGTPSLRNTHLMGCYWWLVSLMVWWLAKPMGLLVVNLVEKGWWSESFAKGNSLLMLAAAVSWCSMLINMIIRMLWWGFLVARWFAVHGQWSIVIMVNNASSWFMILHDVSWRLVDDWWLTNGWLINSRWLDNRWSWSNKWLIMAKWRLANGWENVTHNTTVINDGSWLLVLRQ